MTRLRLKTKLTRNLRVSTSYESDGADSANGIVDGVNGVVDKDDVAANPPTQ